MGGKLDGYVVRFEMRGMETKSNDMSKQYGLTLIELLVTLAILAILMTIALPSFRDFFASNRIATASSDLVTNLNLARSEAIRRGMPVRLVSTNGGGDWTGGWTIVVDTNNDGDYTDTGEELRRAGQASTLITIASSFTTMIEFQPSGRANTAGNFFICHDANTGSAREISVNMIGRIRTLSAGQCS